MKKRILFIDRDGTLIREPEDEQIDSFSKLRFTEGMFQNLGFIRRNLDFYFVMVSNQDGLGTDSFPKILFGLSTTSSFSRSVTKASPSTSN